ncbi:ABC transporter ATP-binding protein [Terrarubrum flagellatum]|uniref:ABC transporter ATP-binding protein n=1 Tax=Terrirubrum flagellatum TaxID=2895980 RepID=UPI0031453C06
MSAFLKVENVSKTFAPRLSLGERVAAALGGAVETRAVHAVDRVSFEIARGETLGLVGESGCGKSTLGRVVAGIHEPTSGRITLDGAPVMSGGRKLTTRVQTVFQDPFSSLNPRIRIGDIIAEGPIAHGLTTKANAVAYARDWLGTVGLDPDFVSRFPHQFSGGQRQRVAIARALAMKPDLLVCDEPVASLDVSIQAQIINLFLRLRRELNLTMLFISHDIGVVRHLCDRIAIMYLGRIVEIGTAAEVHEAPQHPYSQALLDSVPKLVIQDGAIVEFKPIAGELPSPLSPPKGCHFHARCPHTMSICRTTAPDLRAAPSGALAACHLIEKAAAAA